MQLLQRMWAETWRLSQEWLQAMRLRYPRGYRVGRYGIWGLSGMLGLLVLFYVAIWMGISGPLPNKTQLMAIENPLASEVYSSDGHLLGKYYVENRSQATFEDLPVYLTQALVATEDARFYDHSGVDTRSLFRVFFKSILLMDREGGGGSTLSQQLAKNLFPRRSYGWFSIPVNKVREMIIARRMERVYTKEQILALYLNTVPFGESAFGIGTAARRFFNRSPKDLRIEEAATLVGMLKATSYYNPRLHPDRALERRNTVLEQMHKYEILSPEETDSLQALPLTLDYRRFTPREGLSPYFQSRLGMEVKDWLKAHGPANRKAYNLYTDGLKIYTTIDSRLQSYAKASVEAHMKELQEAFFRHWGTRAPWGKDLSVIERAVLRSDRYRDLSEAGVSKDSIKAIFAHPIPMRIFSWEGEIDTVLSPLDSVTYYQRFLNAGFLAMEPQTGQVRAWVGGIDFRYFQYDHVTARRQAGSTFKPLVYAAALETGRDPCVYLANELITYEDYDAWTPGNADEEYGGYYSMEGALTHSVNTASVALIMETGVKNVTGLAYKMGIKQKLPEQPSIALGAADLSLMDLVTVYAGFANGGKRVTPQYLLRIETKDGELLFEAPAPDPGEQVMNEENAHLITHMLQSVVDSGTGAALRYRYHLPGDIAGKTGTTQSHADGWFLGFTPHLVAGAWVGAEDPKVHFRSLSMGQGAKTALPIWAGFFQRVYADPDFRGWRRAQFAPLSEGQQELLNCPPFKESMENEFRPTDLFEQLFQDLFKKNEEKKRQREARKQEREAEKMSENDNREHGRFMKKLKKVFEKEQ